MPKNKGNSMEFVEYIKKISNILSKKEVVK